MADVVRIWDRLERMPKRPRTKTYDAIILLFTGVRYERRDFVVAATAENTVAQQHNTH